jgi:integrase/recombinase XerD
MFVVDVTLAQPDPSTANGRRDLVLLCVLYDSGARVQELVDLKIGAVRIAPPPILTLTGKGRKSRQVPIMSNTQALLKQYMDEAFSLQNGMQDQPLFFNRQRRKMTRAGISFILDKYVSQARAKSPIIPSKVTPHVIRHTKAMLLLQAGVSLIYIRDLLGHVDIATTEIYARADTEMKRKALEKAYPDIVAENLPNWQKDEALLSWLTRL